MIKKGEDRNPRLLVVQSPSPFLQAYSVFDVRVARALSPMSSTRV
jgi:hypothetical protein